MKDQNMEKTIQQQNRLRLNRTRIQQHGHSSLLVKSIAVQRRLYHDEAIAHVFVIQDVSHKRRFVGGIIEDL